MNDPEAFDEEQFSAGLPDNSHRVRTRYSQSAAQPAPDGVADRHPGAASARSGIERAFAEREALEARLDQAAQCWRDEVTNRVDSYRTRRSRKRLAGEFSMRFDFERPTRTAAARAPEYEEPQSAAVGPAPQPGPAAEMSAAAEQVADAESVPAPQQAEEVFRPLPPLPGGPAVLPQRESKVIAFPRSLVFPEFAEDPYALFEPMLDKPRILDVPEAVPAESAPLADIALQPETEQEPAPQPAFELPLRVASLPRRFAAALFDWLIVLVATAMFIMIAGRDAAMLPRSKPVLAFVLALPVVFWAVYNYLFLVYRGLTPGMQMARVRLSSFEGTPVGQGGRRWRALVMLLSCVSLGFGFFWALFDEDDLCWHDRMTRTYLTER
ncbi:MAG: RDD family protein [Terriglobales bacterium]